VHVSAALEIELLLLSDRDSRSKLLRNCHNHIPVVSQQVLTKKKKKNVDDGVPAAEL